MSRNVGKKLTFYAALNPKRVQISFTPQRKTEISLDSNEYIPVAYANAKVLCMI